MSHMYIRPEHVINHDIHVRQLAKEFQYLISCVLTDY